jgi:putative transposase
MRLCSARSPSRRLPGHVYHLTHRCHDRQFLLRLTKDRDNYRRLLREAVQNSEACS